MILKSKLFWKKLSDIPAQIINNNSINNKNAFRKLYKKTSNFPEHVEMEWDLLDIIVTALISPYSNYSDNYYIEITSEEIKFLYNCYCSNNKIDYESFYNMIESTEEEDDDNDDYVSINDYYSIENVFDKKYGRNGILNLFSCREGIHMKDNKYDKNDILWHIYPNTFLSGLSCSYKKDMEIYSF